ncbi:MAG: hypothetical protein M5T61_20950 [Acidimicrobiia bacterium]|nr:hypothetical protein [Acidimicrobiia bacterium]
MKLVVTGDIPNDWYSEALLRYTAHVDGGNARREAQRVRHGVWCETRVALAELGDADVVIGCDEAYSARSERRGWCTSSRAAPCPTNSPEGDNPHDRSAFNLIVETDLDPSLALSGGATMRTTTGK